LNKFDCEPCPVKHNCCQEGVWADLEEAKRILSLGLRGEFFHLEKDETFPSGYKVSTCHEDSPCSFLNKDGLCSIHKISYNLKPTYCKQFPYEDGEVSSDAKYLCILYKEQLKNKKESPKRKSKK